MAEHDADREPLFIYGCKIHGTQWLPWNRICPKCIGGILLDDVDLRVIDMRDDENQRAFLKALKEQGVPCG